MITPELMLVPGDAIDAEYEISGRLGWLVELLIRLHLCEIKFNINTDSQLA